MSCSSGGRVRDETGREAGMEKTGKEKTETWGCLRREDNVRQDAWATEPEDSEPGDGWIRLAGGKTPAASG